MNFRQMEYITFVAQEGNITRAAQKLHIAQPSMSQTIRVVEEELGGPLFQRHSQPLKPTYIGERYLATAQEILRLRDRLFDELEDISNGLSGKIVVGVSLRRSREIISSILMELTKQQPNLHVQLVHEKSPMLEKMLLHGDVDVAFMNFKSVQPQIESIQLCNEELLFAVHASSPLAERLLSYSQFSLENVDSSLVPVSMLADAQLVLLKEGTYSRDQCDKIFRQASIIPNIYMETENTELAIGIAEATGICTIFPHIVKAANTTGSKLLLYRLDSKYATRNFYFAYNNSRYASPSQQVFTRIATALLQ